MMFLAMVWDYLAFIEVCRFIHMTMLCSSSAAQSSRPYATVECKTNPYCEWINVKASKTRRFFCSYTAGRCELVYVVP